MPHLQYLYFHHSIICHQTIMSSPLSLLLLLFTLIDSTVSQQEGFWSINCGGSTNYTDELGISWTGDGEFVQTGESRNGTDGRSSLRVFTSKPRKNCYTIPVGKGKTILLRMTFNYGNYDGKANPPEMEIIFDGNSGGKLNTTMEGSNWREIIYVTKWKETDVCVGRINSDQDPFMSQIEIRTLEDSMYSFRVDSGKVLRLYSRIAFGANQTIRYPNDSYDRIWSAETLSGLGYRAVTSDITNFTQEMTSSIVENPPPLLLASGIEPNTTDPEANITIPLSYLPSDNVKLYTVFYFTKMSDLTGSTEKREFKLTLNGGGPWWKDIVPLYRNVTRKRWSGFTATKESMFALVPGKNSSTLPPIISGLEIYTITDAYDVTNEDDVKSLSILQKHFPILGEWTGDPCLPTNYNWEWVGCAYYTSPRVTKLDLSGYGLEGSLPDFGDLNFLISINLSNNNLSGEIPDLFTNFPKLETLNLADNNFSGTIPISLSQNESVKQNYSGNPRLINLPSTRSSPVPQSGVHITKSPNKLIFLILYVIMSFIK